MKIAMKLPGLNRLKLLCVHFIAAAFLLFSFHGSAQNPELFNHTWYFANGEENGQALFPTQNTTATVNFYATELHVWYPYCSGGLLFQGVQYDANNTTFQLLGPHQIILDDCGSHTPNESLFRDRHNQIYGDLGIGVIYNPFTYAIATISNYFQLTITNADGDWAVYNSVLLSTPDFNATGFALYPNPVKETLQVSNTSNQAVKVSIYDISGKKLQSHSLQNNLSTMNVRTLSPGLYFVVFENEDGQRVSKKFIKN